MKKSARILFNLGVILGIMLIINSGCKKEEEKPAEPDPVTPTAPTAETVTDIDGNVYHTVKIGTQTWMVENLKTTKYRNGTEIPSVTSASEWQNLTTSAMCDYNNSTTYGSIYGKLYNGYAVRDHRNIAPTGWHIPSDDEWKILTDFLGGETIAGGKMKEKGTTHWLTPNAEADNSSGFTALPAGFRSFYGTYIEEGSYTCWWSMTVGPGSLYELYQRTIFTDNGKVDRWYDDFKMGHSVRCLKD